MFIVHLLYLNGNWISQDWQEVVKLYEKDGIYLGQYHLEHKVSVSLRFFVRNILIIIRQEP